MKKYKMETTVGIFVFVGLLAVGLMTIKLGKVSFIGGDSYSLSAEFTTVSGLRAGNRVEMFGIEVGQVKKMTINQEEQTAVVELELQKGIKVYDDAIASIKTAGLIGDKYVHLNPGGAGEVLPPGESIMETTAPTDLTELMSKYAFGDVDETK